MTQPAPPILIITGTIQFPAVIRNRNIYFILPQHPRGVLPAKSKKRSSRVYLALLVLSRCYSDGRDRTRDYFLKKLMLFDRELYHAVPNSLEVACIKSHFR